MSGPAKVQVRQKLENCNFISVKIRHLITNALIDTGAFYSCVSLSFVKRLRLESHITPVSKHRRLFTADGKPMHVLGTVNLTLDIQDFEIPVTFCVLPRLQFDVILGVQFLTQTKANIDMECQTLTFYNDLVKTGISNKSDTVVRTTEAILIPPKSECVIPVMVPPHFGAGLAIIEPSNKLHTLQLALAKSLVSPMNNRTVCKVMNPTGAARFLRKKTPLGVIRNLEIDNVAVITNENLDSNSHGEVLTPDTKITLEEKLQRLSEKGVTLPQNSLTNEEFTKLTELLFRNIDLFATSMQDLVGTKSELMHIDTGDAKPVRQRPYRQSPEMQRQMENLIDQMLSANIIQPSDSPWSSPCLLIKKSGTDEYRFVNDLRALNKLTKPMFWPLPTLDDIFDLLSNKNPRFFSQIDIKHAYFQVFLDEESRPKTAFTANGRHYEYTRMVMGLCNSAQTWQRLLVKVLSDMVFESAIVYLDDILLIGRDFPEHFGYLEKLFQRFRDANLRMNGKKCSFAKSEVKYIGHILSKDGIRIDPSKADAISSWPRPKTHKHIKSFLGMANYHKRFIDRYSQRSAPLRNLLSKNVPFRWGDDQEKSFQDLKQALISPPILRFPDSSRSFHLQTDASLDGISYILGQTDDEGRKYVISYGGRGLRPCEKKWPITQLECLSLLTGIREFHVYLAAAPFVVYTDHISLKYLESLKISAHNRLARWALALQPYKFVVEHIPGSKLTAADGLSRRPYDTPTNLEADEELQEDSFIAQLDPDIFESVSRNKTRAMRCNLQPLTPTTVSDNDETSLSTPIQDQVDDQLSSTLTDNTKNELIDLWSQKGLDLPQLQYDSKDLRPIIEWLRDGRLPDIDKEARRVIFEAENYQIVNDVLYHLHFPRTKRLSEFKPVIQQLCVPEVLREELLVAYHDNNGHIGRDRLYDTLKQKYYFREMYTSVHEYVSTCEECQKTKTSPHRKKAPLSPLPIGPPFSRIHLDHMGPLPETPEGYRHLLVVIDATTLWAEAFPVKSTTAEETADVMYREIICRFGAPKAILTDQGTAYKNRLIALLCKLLRIKHIYSSPFHPEGNAKVERANRTIATALRMVCPNQTDWAKYIQPILYSYRASVATPLGISPFEALFGKQMSMGIDLQLLQEAESAPSISAYATDLVSKLKVIQDVVKQNVTDSGLRAKTRYDEKAETPVIMVGSKVLLHSNVVKPGQSAKFHRP